VSEGLVRESLRKVVFGVALALIVYGVYRILSSLRLSWRHAPLIGLVYNLAIALIVIYIGFVMYRMSRGLRASKPAARLKVIAGSPDAKILLTILMGVVPIMILDILPPISNYIYWDGGVWEDAQVIHSKYRVSSYPPPMATLYRDSLFMFYNIISKSTINDDCLIGPEEYELYDIVYRTWDGSRWSDEYEMTSTLDEKSHLIMAVAVYNGELHLVFEERYIVNYTTYKWTQRVLLRTFDGTNWSEAEQLLTSGDYTGRIFPGDISLISFDEKLWAIWKPDRYQGAPPDFRYKTFDGNHWSPTKSFQFPTENAIHHQFTVYDGQLWAIWAYRHPKSCVPVGEDSGILFAIDHLDIYMGELVINFDGASWKNVTELTLPDKIEVNFRPHLIVYDHKLYAIWETSPSPSVERWLEGKKKGYHIVVRSYDKGILGDLIQVDRSITDNQDINCAAKVTSYNGKLYILWYYTDHDSALLIRSFDRNEWSDVFEITGSVDDYKLVVYDGKLYVYWLGRTDKGWEIMIRCYSNV